MMRNNFIEEPPKLENRLEMANNYKDDTGRETPRSPANKNQFSQSIESKTPSKTPFKSPSRLQQICKKLKLSGE